ncbi:5-oxoprolinase [Polymorphobacter multimanifer]|uniref:hydantoinase B/oxoprolinase family protein n=1 Tax=Polymorphobacter multimanifer TaxID=1070431 RepID=UPI00166F5DF0|nr:hydantoinase B/oxoprolinase family protein [Polymorphobacter multimanifer]GGI89358.1 5-oxoprolinase [Polymorphobacter multimanifer]
MSGWHFWIDRGGTFTDIVARSPAGRLATAKLLSHAPELYADAALEGIARLRATEAGPIADVRMGTTVATNALLEGKGAPTLLAITRGHGDALTIGHQARPAIFALDIVRPLPLQAMTVEIDERLAADGAVVVPLDAAAARAALQRGFDAGLRSVAIVLMHAWVNPAHELQLADIAREIGFSYVTASHQVGRLIKLVPRGQSAVVDAYLSPPLGAHVGVVADALSGVPLGFMQSSGGLAAPGHFHGRNAVLSGPAGGIVGMSAVCRGAEKALLGFDMGGTSTDVSMFAGRFDRAEETVVAGYRIASPSLRIDTVAAGGGSIVRAEGSRLRVGPASAGARPGPASYGHGGPLTITDCNVALGRLQPEHFPALFGPEGDAALDGGAVADRLAGLAAELDADPLDLAEGAIAIAVETMAAAIRAISTLRGHDPAAATLVGFGGAAGQHVCAVADALGMDRILLHPLAGVFSAWGIGMADVRTLAQATLALPLSTADAAIADAAGRLAAEAEAALAAQGHGCTRTLLTARIRHKGSDTTTEFPLASAAALAAAFLADQAARFGFAHDGADLIVESIAAEAVSETDKADAVPQAGAAGPTTVHPVRFGGEWHDTPFRSRDGLAPGTMVAGPAVLLDASSTTLVAPGWQGVIDAAHNLVLTQTAAVARPRPGTDRDPVWLELFANRFMAIAEAMGAALQATAWSVNIKERLDFSCAVFDGEGVLIANAPHMPVHLGSMGVSVRAIIGARAGQVRPGDAYMLNDPWAGGTHLPDVTVVMPVFLAESDAPAFWVAARGHQADIGGTSPGSMPADSRTIADEGVLITNWLLVEAGRLREAETLALLAPARDPARCMGDLQAQLAACARGADDLKALVSEMGADTVRAYMGHVQDDAEAAVRRAIAGLHDGEFSCLMDNGAAIRLAVRIGQATNSATLDFSGTSAQTGDHLNAPEAVTRAAALYAFRVLAGGDLPMNDGVLRPLTLIIPEGSILSPAPGAAVVAGNVETSQILTDTIFGALGRLAASQGTMNNLTFGNAAHQYYETIAGGAGASAGAAGASAVQTHMTNSRLTDPEVLELRYPVRVERFAVRSGSGGAGARRGGDGVERTIRFLEPMTVSLLAGRRATAPFGLAGGGAAQAGAGFVTRSDGSVETLGACARAELAAGDAITILTPGGGGFGTP